MKSSRKQGSKRTTKQQAAGALKQEANISQQESVQPSPVEEQTSSSSTIPTQSKMLLVKERLITLTSGIRQALANVYSRVVRLFS